MRKAMMLPLESGRLTEHFVAPLTCYVCQQENTYDAELCRHCAAPMALAHQARSQGLLPQMIAALGSSGAGKTVYLGMLLDMLSRLPERMEVLARGAFSVTLQQNTVAALAECRFPAKTPSDPDLWNWVHCELHLSPASEPLELIIPDMAGEALLAEIEHPHSYPVVRPLLEESPGALLLLDADKLQRGNLDEEYHGMKMLSYLGELTAGGRPVWRSRPLAIVFTKADQCRHCFEDPAAFGERHAPGLWRLCQRRFPHHRYFATCVAGACGFRDVGARGSRECVPLRIEPRGIVESFEWIVRQL